MVGAGIVGAATAYYLSAEGLRVLVAERDTPASGTSGACDGVISLHSKTTGPILALAREGTRLFGQFSLSSEIDMELQQKGSLCMAETESEVESLKKRISLQRSEGLDVRFLDKRELLSLEPRISPHVLGASWCPEDHQVNPLLATFAYLHAARKLGCVVTKGSPVMDILTDKHRVRGLILAGGEKIATGWIINACGVDAPSVGKMVGLDIPIKPRRGQLMVTEPLDTVIGSVLLEYRYLILKHGSGGTDLPSGVSLSLEQTRGGALIIGGTREFTGYEKDTTAEALGLIAERAIHFVPSLKGVRIVRTFAGLRPYPSDGMPIIGEAGDPEGFIVAAGHEGDGIALAPATGKIVSDLVCRRISPYPLSAFSPDRFK